MLIITGASKGIGLEIARAFAAEGMKIILNARNPEGLAKAAAYLHTHGGAEVYTFAADLSERKNVEAFAEFAHKHGTPEVLVNNAGVFYPGQVHQEEEGAFRANDAHQPFQCLLPHARHFAQNDEKQSRPRL